MGTDRARHSVRTLAYQALVRTVQQNGTNARIRALQKCGDTRRSEPHGRSAGLWRLLDEPPLEEQCKPGHDLLVEFSDAAHRGVVFADDRRILVRIEIE